MSSRMLMLTAATFVLAVAACTDRSPIEPSGPAAFSKAPEVAAAPAPWAKILEGETGPSSLYALYIPIQWNGDAVYYIHGIRPPQDPVGFDDTQDSIAIVRDSLGVMGYAVAYSTFDANGLVVKDGAERTHQLRGLLTSALGHPPKRSYLLGFSLGSGIGLDLAESYPNQYDGLLSMCGMVGGSELEMQYVGDVRALFDVFYPGVLPGDVTDAPSPPMSRDSLAILLTSAIGANPYGLWAIASTVQTPLPYLPVGSLMNPSDPAFFTMVNSLAYALYYQLIGIQSVKAQTHGHSPYGNMGVTYTMGTAVIPPLAPMLGAMIAGVDTAVRRYAITPDAQNYLAKYYTPTGDLPFPVLTVHNLYDPLVPYFHETALASIVAAAGHSDMLLQRPQPYADHCDFFTTLTLSSFRDLVDWVTTGIKPAS